MKEDNMGGVCSMLREMSSAFKIVVEKRYEENILKRVDGEGNIRMNLKEVCWENGDWIPLT